MLAESSKKSFLDWPVNSATDKNFVCLCFMLLWFVYLLRLTCIIPKIINSLSILMVYIFSIFMPLNWCWPRHSCV